MINAAAEIWLGTVCPGCGISGYYWGNDFWGRGRCWEKYLCPECQRQIFAANVTPREVRRQTFDKIPIFALLNYEKTARNLILSYKKKNIWRCQYPLGLALAKSIASVLLAHFYLTAIPENILLVPVPSQRKQIRRRGADITRILAFRAASRLQELGVRAGVLPCLRRSGGGSDQKELSALARYANLAGKVKVAADAKARLAASRVIIVDDVVTTGASLLAARTALTGHTKILGAAVIAARGW